MPGLAGVHLRAVLHPSGGHLFDHVWASLTTRRHSKWKEGMGNGELPRYLLCFRSTASARRFLPWRAALSRWELTQGLTVNVGNVEQQGLVLPSRVAAKECPRLRCHILSQWVESTLLPVCSSVQRAVCPRGQLELCSRGGIEPVPGGALDCRSGRSVPSLCMI